MARKIFSGRNKGQGNAGLPLIFCQNVDARKKEQLEKGKAGIGSILIASYYSVESLHLNLVCCPTLPALAAVTGQKATFGQVYYIKQYFHKENRFYKYSKGERPFQKLLQRFIGSAQQGKNDEKA